MKLALSILAFGVLAATAAGQEVVNVRVSSEPPGARFLVDGQQYASAQSFLWPRGSKHVLSVVTSNFSNEFGGTICDEAVGSVANQQYDYTCRQRWSFSGWTNNGAGAGGANLLVQNIIADPATTSYVATFVLEYRVDVTFDDSRPVSEQCMAKANAVVAQRPTGGGLGIAFVNGQCLDYSKRLWLPPGTISLEAYPLEGYVFLGWVTDALPTPGPIRSYNLRGPATLSPRFVPAKRVRIYTDPLELRVRVDRTDTATVDPGGLGNPIYPIPAYFDWVPGSKHVLGAPSPQVRERDGKSYVFQGWNTGGGQDMVFTADEDTSRFTILTAKFVRAASVALFTEPRGLRIKVDGNEGNPPYLRAWGLGEKHTFAAPLEQVDAKGRRWVFQRWEHGGDAAQEITIDQASIDKGSLQFSAIYQALPQTVVQSSLPSVPIQVDGAECASPCRIDKPMGTQVRIAVPPSVPISDIARYDFTGWGDSAQPERVITVDRETLVLTANYVKMHRLMAVLDPADGGAIVTQPASPDGFYAEGADVAFSLDLKPGFKFRRWEGDLTGTIPAGALSMWGPRAVRGLLDRVPHIEPASVRNAAGPTPAEGVAAGSLISISGANLTTEPAVGPASPLAQTLGGVVVLIGDRILPLIYVAPDQLNALLPSDIEPGGYTLKVRPQAGAEMPVEVNVLRNAPGLFSTAVDAQLYAAALHEDGSPITPSSPAKRGETIALMGTGFGPYNRPVVDGFAIPPTSQYTLVDRVDVALGPVTLSPTWAGAAPGMTGVVLVRLRIPADAATGDQNLRVTAGGVESNTVILPIE